MSASNLQTPLAESVISALRSVLGEAPAVLHEPVFSGRESEYLQECVKSTYVSSVGPFVDRFERQLESYTSAKHAIALVNGTAALHMALHLTGVRPGDEVLLPSLTFVATANAVCHSGATPHFVDSETQTLGVDPAELRTYLQANTEQRNGHCINRSTEKIIRALVPVHVFGHPVDIDGLLALSHDFNIALVEDAAESLGSYYHDRHAGTFGVMGILSFNGNKTITTGGGGAILTDDSVLAQRAKHITSTAKIPHRWAFEHDEVGYNYRMPNINAALGCAQLDQLPQLLEAKRTLYQRYQIAFSTIQGVQLMREPDSCRSNYWLQTLILDEPCAGMRDSVLQACHEAGFLARPAWNPLHQLKPFANCPRAHLPVAERLSESIINIPSSSSLANRPRSPA